MTAAEFENDPGLFFALSSAPMAILSSNGVVVSENQAFASAFARDEQVQGVSLSSLVSAEDRMQVERSLAAAAHGEASALDVHAKATARSLRFQVTHIADGAILLSGVFVADEKADDALRLKIFDRILASGPVCYWVTDEKGIFIRNAGKASERIGIPAGSLVGQSYEMFKGTDFYQFNLDVLAGKEFHTQVSAPGAECEIWYLPMRDEGGTVTGSVGFSIDLTEQRRAERELRTQLSVVEKQNETLNLFARVLQTAPLIVWSVDLEGTVTMLDGKGLELIGVTRGEPVGQNAIELFKGRPDVVGPIMRALSGEETRTITSPAPGVEFDSWHLPLRGRDGSVQGAIGLSIDVTERMRTQRELRDKLELIERQSQTIRALATPIIRVWDEVLCLPVIGTVDSARTADMMQALLEAIVDDQARYAIVDLTGVEVVDTSTADHLIQLFRAARVLGVDGVLCGIRPAVAQTIVALGLDLGSIKTMRSLRDALKWCIRTRSQSVVSPSAQLRSHAIPANTNHVPHSASLAYEGNGLSPVPRGGDV